MSKSPITPLAAIVLMALCIATSCSQNHTVTTYDDGPEIVLGAAFTGTKGTVSTTGDMIDQCYEPGENGALKPGTGFGVYGFKTVREETKHPALFDNTLVYPKYQTRPPSITTSWNWTYQPLRHWDLTASYQFLAYWPWRPSVDENAEGFNRASHPGPYVAFDDPGMTMYLRNVPNWQEVDGSEDDYMTAMRHGSYGVQFPSGVVTMRFEHLLSKLVIKAYYMGKDLETKKDDQDDVDGGGVVINGIMLGKSDAGDQVLGGVVINDTIFGKSDVDDQDWSTGSTDFMQNCNDDIASQDTGPGANTIDMADSCMLLYKASRRAVFKNEETGEFMKWDAEGDSVKIESGPALIGSWLMVPHLWKDLKLSVLYSMGGNAVVSNFAASTPVPVTIAEENYEYMTQPGKIYTITLVLDSSGNGLTVVSVAVGNWTTHDVSREVYNW